MTGPGRVRRTPRVSDVVAVFAIWSARRRPPPASRQPAAPPVPPAGQHGAGRHQKSRPGSVRELRARRGSCLMLTEIIRAVICSTIADLGAPAFTGRRPSITKSVRRPHLVGLPVATDRHVLVKVMVTGRRSGGADGMESGDHGHPSAPSPAPIRPRNHPRTPIVRVAADRRRQRGTEQSTGI